MPADTPDTSTTPGDTSLVSVLATFDDEGWPENHLVKPEAKMKCGNCGELSAADELTVDARHRVEGASDPSDMQAVFGITCPKCDAKGSLVASYGPEASEQDSEFTASLDETGDPVDPVAAGE